MLSIAEKRDRIQKLLESGDFFDIFEKDIKQGGGKINIPKRFLNCRAIIIIEKLESPAYPSEKKRQKA